MTLSTPSNQSLSMARCCDACQEFEFTAALATGSAVNVGAPPPGTTTALASNGRSHRRCAARCASILCFQRTKYKPKKMNEIAPHGLKKYAKEIDTTSKSAPIPGTTHASVQDMYSVLPAANISVAVLSSYKECAEGAPPLGSPVVLDTFLGEVASWIFRRL